MHIALDALPSAKRARVEIIPLIDVIFFLLATFVLFTLSLQKIRQLEAPLPTSAARPAEGDTTLFLLASAQGTYFWQIGARGVPETIGREEVAPRLADYRRAVAVPRVVVRGDRTAKFGAAVFALDEVRKAGIKQVVVETIPGAVGG